MPAPFFSVGFRSRIFLQLPLFMLTAAILQGCNPIDQRTFDPNANRPPVVPPKVDHTPKAKPFIEIVEGTPPDVYRAPLQQAVKTALAHKPNILFTIEGLAPPQATPQEQFASLKVLLDSLVVPIATQITEAGAQPIQLDIRVGTDRSIKQSVVRINVR
ncbi:hypothetical protein PT277_01795 [Acetobacteraceae bacterium ESL0709]|nr:hypothetical protein [Acetobacteraceae bacterium ESL0697]MDF7677435.1 hypothetical protein [Acetobacteraceae bacterium ESL0709]